MRSIPSHTSPSLLGPVLPWHCTTDLRASPQPGLQGHAFLSFLLLLLARSYLKRPCFPFRLKNTCHGAQPHSTSSSLPFLQRTFVFSFPWCQTPREQAPCATSTLTPPPPRSLALSPVRPSNTVPSLGWSPQIQMWLSPSLMKTFP